MDAHCYHFFPCSETPFVAVADSIEDYSPVAVAVAVSSLVVASSAETIKKQQKTKSQNKPQIIHKTANKGSVQWLRSCPLAAGGQDFDCA